MQTESRLSKIYVHFQNKLNMISMPTQLPLFNAICHGGLNTVSRHLKRIGKEETGYHKPFSFNLKEVVSAKCLLKTYCVNPSCVYAF